MKRALLPALVLAALSPAPRADELFFMVDCTPPFGAAFDGTNKLGAAVNAIIADMPAWPETLGAGLGVYGHKVEDCGDVDVPVLPGERRREPLRDQLLALRPVGRASLNKSLEISGQVLLRENRPTRMLLVGDGMEFCRAYPCAAIQAFRNMGLQLTVDVLALNPEPLFVDQLACMAKAGGGTCTVATNRAQVAAAVAAFRQAAVQAAPPPEIDPAAPLANFDLLLPERPIARAAAYARFTDPAGKPVHYIAPAKPATSHSLPPGEYRVRLGFVLVPGRAPVDVPAGAFTVAAGDNPAVQLGGFALTGSEKHAFLQIRAADGAALLTAPGEWLKRAVPWGSGTFSLWSGDSDEGPWRDLGAAVTVKPGGVTAVTVP